MRLSTSLTMAHMWNMGFLSQRCWESVWKGGNSSLPRLCRASAGKMADSTMWSSRVKLLWEGLYPGFPEWEFPLHGVWGNLAELYWEGLVWTPRRAFPRIPSAGSWERSRFAIADGSYTPAQGDGRGLPRPRQIQSPPGGPWTCLIRPLNHNKFLTLINFNGENLFIIAKETNNQNGRKA